MFTCEHSVTLDILAFGKSLGGGQLPFAGTAALYY